MRFFMACLLGLIAVMDVAGSEKRFHVIERFAIDRPDLRLWVPLPLESAYQQVANLEVKGNFSEKRVTTDPVYGARILYLGFEGERHHTVTISFDVSVHDRHTDFNRHDVHLPSASLAPYLQGTDHLRIDGVVKAYADRITAGVNEPLAKAERIYEWTVQNMFRDPKTRGCGVGDAYQSLESGYLGGKCADVSAVFVALLRAAGIPAREVFGIRAGASEYSSAYGVKGDEITTAQHCRAEFYIDGIGWVPADPADVTKLILVEGLDRQSDRVRKESERQFGSWEMNWFAYNSARDFILQPEPVQYPLSIFSYPYAESGDEPLDYYDPKQFSYTIHATELP